MTFHIVNFWLAWANILGVPYTECNRFYSISTESPQMMCWIGIIQWQFVNKWTTVLCSFISTLCSSESLAISNLCLWPSVEQIKEVEQIERTKFSFEEHEMNELPPNFETKFNPYVQEIGANTFGGKWTTVPWICMSCIPVQEWLWGLHVYCI